MDPRAALAEADALHQTRRFADAASAYRRALKGDPALFEAWYGLGCASASQAAHGEAIEALRRAVALRPDAIGARCNLAEALFELGQADAAVAEYRQAAEPGIPRRSAIALGALACIAPGCPGMDHAGIRAVRERWAASVGRGIHPCRRLAEPVASCASAMSARSSARATG